MIQSNIKPLNNEEAKDYQCDSLLNKRGTLGYRKQRKMRRISGTIFLRSELMEPDNLENLDEAARWNSGHLQDIFRGTLETISSKWGKING